MKKANFETLEPFCFPFSHWPVKGLSSKRLALKADVIGPGKNILFAGASVHLSARIFYRPGGSEGVKWDLYVSSTIMVCRRGVHSWCKSDAEAIKTNRQQPNTVQLNCLCVDTLAFWLVICMKHSMHFTIKHEHFNKTRSSNPLKCESKILNNLNAHTHT